MSDLLSMGVGVVGGGAVSSPYYKSLGSAEAQAKKLGERWEKTNKRASAVGDLVRYRAALDTLRRKQGVPALAPNAAHLGLLSSSSAKTCPIASTP